MAKVVLISCASKKLSHKTKAKDIYISPLFKMNLKFAKSFNPDKMFILSAKTRVKWFRINDWSSSNIITSLTLLCPGLPT